MKRIDNIEELIADLDIDGIIFTINDLDIDQTKFPSEITWEQIRNMITERYNRSQKDVFEVEEAVLSVSDLHRVVFTDEIIADTRERVKEWLIPLETIFDRFKYNYCINFIDEAIKLDFKDYPDLSKRLGIREDTLLENKINSFFFYQFEAEILRLYHLINRNSTIDKVKNSINSK